MKSRSRLVLASTSVYRRELLARLQIPFDCIAPGVDETPHPDEEPVALVTRLALAKATAVAAHRATAWVIGSDQLAVLELDASTRLLGKPGSAARCQEQLLSCSERTLAFVTAVAVVQHETDARIEFIDTTQVSFRKLDPATVARYVERESPLDCAGGFKSEGLGITLCESIESEDPTALVGLPLIRLSAALRQAGFELP